MKLMSALLTPAPLPELAYSRFRFVPAITGAGHNEWTLCRVTWTEVVVANVRSGQEIAIPRRFLGRVFETDDNVRDVRLLEDLEYAAGRARPVQRGVIELRVSPAEEKPVWLRREPGHHAAVVAIRTEASGRQRGLRSAICFVVVVGLALWQILAGLR